MDYSWDAAPVTHHFLTTWEQVDPIHLASQRTTRLERPHVVDGCQLAPTTGPSPVLPTCSPPPWCLPSFQFLDSLAIRVHSSPPWPHRPGGGISLGYFSLEVCGAHGPLPSYQLPLAVHHYSLQHACKNKKTSVIEQKGFKMLRKYNIPRDNTCFFPCWCW